MAAPSPASSALNKHGAAHTSFPALPQNGAAHTQHGARIHSTRALPSPKMAPAPSAPPRRRFALIGRALPSLCADWLRARKWRRRLHVVAMAGGGVSGRTDPFPGPAPVPRPRVKRFLRGAAEKAPRPVAPRLRWHLKNLEKREKEAAEKAARWEPLLPEEPGFLEPDPGQDPTSISQREIAEAVDVAAASKHFELRLEQFGPYRVDYTRNGRYLLLGGQRGHVAALDWNSKRLLSEFNVLETINDLTWLHSESLLAVAQRRWLHVYDSQGLELHVLPKFPGILRLQFLPFHFLLVTASELGLLQFLDVSVGKEVSTLRPRCGRLAVMAQNPHNALVHLGHPNGTVSPVEPQRCRARQLMATSGLDRKIRIFDLRNFGILQEWGGPAGAAALEFSQRGLLAAACGDLLQ
ncbi:WD repeat-containing protein 46-like, partial [Manacus candei]|uniref:WD repeat-containing protein 46-like n=1 Tax=Manacus candei TaxID=415023 RepID=UPI00222606F8